jgi:hypothetical protein
VVHCIEKEEQFIQLMILCCTMLYHVRVCCFVCLYNVSVYLFSTHIRRKYIASTHKQTKLLSNQPYYVLISCECIWYMMWIERERIRMAMQKLRYCTVLEMHAATAATHKLTTTTMLGRREFVCEVLAYAVFTCTIKFATMTPI